MEIMMELKLRDDQDVYSGRELAHLVTGIPYDKLDRITVTRVVQELNIPEIDRLRYFRWPNGPIISCLYIMRNHELYRPAPPWGKIQNYPTIKKHLSTLPIPPAATGRIVKKSRTKRRPQIQGVLF